jgi:outer membrane protein TolC
MLKFILIFIMSVSFAYAQSYKDVLKQIGSNNKEIKAYKEYLNSVNIESRINNLPFNPKVEYSFLTGSGIAKGNKQELLISQPFDFPSIYFLKSDIASLQRTANEFRLKEFQKEIIKSAQGLITKMIYYTKRVDELLKRYESADNILKTVQAKFDKGEIGILELNKSKASLSVAKSKLNLAKIELGSIKSEIVNLNGGQSIELNLSDYWKSEYNTDFETLFIELKEADNYYKFLEREKMIYDKHLSLARSGWLPNFDIGYRQESEPELELKGVRLQMSIPIFENINKVPKAKSELNASELNIQSYNSRFYLEKKILFEKSVQLKKSLEEQKELVDFSQLELNKKSYELGHISLTQYYLDNTLYYEIVDSIQDIELQYYEILSDMLTELLLE